MVYDIPILALICELLETNYVNLVSVAQYLNRGYFR